MIEERELYRELLRAEQKGLCVYVHARVCVHGHVCVKS